MKYRLSLTIALLAVFATAALSADNELTAQEKAEGWRLLFDGTTLNGWKPTGNSTGWAVEDGAIARVAGGGGYLHTVDQFGNFILSIDYKITPKCNSGVFVRWSDLRDPVNTGTEMQVFDSSGKAKPNKHDDGAIYDLIAPTKNMTKPVGEWNHAVITCNGPIIRVELNGEQICEMNVDQWTEAGKNPDGTKNKFTHAYKDMARVGCIGLQDHGHKVWFKNIKVKEIK